MKQGYFTQTKLGKIWSICLSLLFVSITFGMFFALFFLIIPYVGWVVSLILLFPVLTIWTVMSVLVNILSYFFTFNFDFISGLSQTSGVFLLVAFPFFSWFAWIFLLGQNVKIAFTPFTQKGKDMLWHIKGYQKFLRKVDRDRLSFSLDRDLDYQRNNTTFSWLAIFSILQDKHWDQFYEVHQK